MKRYFSFFSTVNIVMAWNLSAAEVFGEAH
jgi:hypothetical protein